MYFKIEADFEMREEVKSLRKDQSHQALELANRIIDSGRDLTGVRFYIEGKPCSVEKYRQAAKDLAEAKDAQYKTIYIRQGAAGFVRAKRVKK